MVTIKLKFKASIQDITKGVIYYQLIYRNSLRHIKSSSKIFVDEWDETLSQIIIPSPSSPRYTELLMIKERIRVEHNRIYMIIASLNQTGDISLERVAMAFDEYSSSASLFKFMQSLIFRFSQMGKYGTSSTYQSTLNSFMQFRNSEDILISDITPDMLLYYQSYLESRGVTMNTISFYMRILRATYNRAVDRGLVEQQFPFKRAYTGVDKTVKRALSLKYIKKIKKIDLTQMPDLVFARDMFMMSFYTRGMSFVDMAYLRTRDVKNNTLSYCRRKTGQQLNIKLEMCIQEIISRYPNFNTDYLLPIIRKRHKDDRSQYKSQQSVVNIKLKRLGELIGSPIPLSLYVARHSWASIAKSRNIPISVISEGMGHDSEATTQIYLASLDNSVVDRANNSILKLL